MDRREAEWRWDVFLSESYIGIRLRVRAVFLWFWVCFVKKTDNFPAFLTYTKFHFAFELLMNEQGADGIGQCQMCPYLGGRIGAEWFGPLSIIKDLRFYRPNTRAQITFSPTGAPRVKVFQPTRGGSPRLHVVFNSLNPPIGLMLEEFCWCLRLSACCVRVCVCVCAHICVHLPPPSHG